LVQSIDGMFYEGSKVWVDLNGEVFDFLCNWLHDGCAKLPQYHRRIDTLRAEAKYIDLYFVPDDASIDVPILGLLWKCVSTGMAFEAFRCAVQDDEIRSTMGKLLSVHEDITRETKRKDCPVSKTAELPRLWIITPTMSKHKLKACNVITEERG
jgi:hypothetical protein